ncbi:MAG: L,D-transpeptidase family protein [Proteobacteria bacterium]|nr:L,D-transpeptidase family protein [Pseudomonadota bacterium]
MSLCRQKINRAIVLAGLLGVGWLSPVSADEFPVADSVIIEKAARKLYLLQDGEIFRTFDIALGIQPDGDKMREGDFRTPEGRYRLDRRNPNSEFFLSIHVSYPNQQDRRKARQKGVEPGGAIMIHGQPNVPTKSETYYHTQDWTNGCIAVSNSDMIDIWLMTGENTPIEIRP